jgi:hypothetical protein
MADRNSDGFAVAACGLVIRHFRLTALLAAGVSIAGMVLILR